MDTIRAFGMDVLGVVLTAVVPILATYAVNALKKIAAKHGIELQQQRLDRLDQMLVNGLNLAAASATAGASSEAIKQQAIEYVKRQGPELLADLKADLSDPKTQEAIKARIETAIADATKPTPAVLDGK